MKAIRTAFWWFALPAALASLRPEWWVYDRAAILRGEWWRLVTGHWVHFSTSHLLWDLAALLVAGTWLEKTHSGMLARLTLIGAPLIGGGLFVSCPDMACYGGLSGLAVGAVVLMALLLLKACPTTRLYGYALLALVIAKFGYELGSTVPVFSWFSAGNMRVSIPAHLLGAASALVVFARTDLRSRHMIPSGHHKMSPRTSS